MTAPDRRSLAACFMSAIRAVHSPVIRDGLLWRLHVLRANPVALSTPQNDRPKAARRLTGVSIAVLAAAKLARVLLADLDHVEHLAAALRVAKGAS